MRTLDLNDVRLLMKVIEHGSYTAAARATGIPKSTISQRIAQLERAVGTGLLRRTSRSFSLTEAGAVLLPHAQAIDRLAREAETALLQRGDELA
jgi:LysR family transcriptional regulator for bpeEF and oprC